MNVDRVCHLLSGRTKLYRQYKFVDDIRPLFTDDMCAEKFLSLGV
jgi:hypothetical protein